jgi:hypothetical protein
MQPFLAWGQEPRRIKPIEHNKSKIEAFKKSQ